jgi:hypothetical protein
VARVALVQEQGQLVLNFLVPALEPPKVLLRVLLMNTRGMMELTVLNIGLDVRVISPTLFASWC